jgi:ribosomal protein S18 acetylase RimI-like enzyme
MSITSHQPGSAVVEIWLYDGPRSALRQSFEEAEDSAAQLDSYVDLGEVLVAQRGSEILGHLQLTETAVAGEVELKNMAVREDQRGYGIGRQLVDAALERAADACARRMVVATAAADIGNLRFYQRCGFRFVSVERDAFVPATGYPEPIEIDGIALRDRVWLDRELWPEKRLSGKDIDGPGDHEHDGEQRHRGLGHQQ